MTSDSHQHNSPAHSVDSHSPKKHGWIRRNLTLIQYVVGIALLTYIITSKWESTPAKITETDHGIALLGGSPVITQVDYFRHSPGLKEIISKKELVLVWPLVLAVVIFVLALLITFIRWYVLVRAQNLPFTIRNALRLGLVSFFFNSFLPGSVGGDILKAVVLAREQSRRAVAVATIILDRVIGLWALAWLVALSGGIFWALGNPYVIHNNALKTIILTTSTIVFVSAVVWSLMGLLTPQKSEKVAEWFERIPKVGGAAGEFWRAGWMYRKKKKAVALALGMTLIGHLGWVLIFHLCVSAFPDIDAATFPEHLLVVPVGMTAQAMFPLPGGIGGGEAAYGWLYSLLGKSPTGGILGCLVVRMITWGIGAIGYVIYTRMKKEIPAVIAEAEAAAV